jgi:hypothetical protein
MFRRCPMAYLAQRRQFSATVWSYSRARIRILACWCQHFRMEKSATVTNAWSVGSRFRSLGDEKDKLQMQISACQPCDLHGITNSLDLSPSRGISARNPAAARFETIAGIREQCSMCRPVASTSPRRRKKLPGWLFSLHPSEQSSPHVHAPSQTAW